MEHGADLKSNSQIGDIVVAILTNKPYTDPEKNYILGTLDLAGLIDKMSYGTGSDWRI